MNKYASLQTCRSCRACKCTGVTFAAHLSRLVSHLRPLHTHPQHPVNRHFGCAPPRKSFPSRRLGRATSENLFCITYTLAIVPVWLYCRLQLFSLIRPIRAIVQSSVFLHSVLAFTNFLFRERTLKYYLNKQIQPSYSIHFTIWESTLRTLIETILRTFDMFWISLDVYFLGFLTSLKQRSFTMWTGIIFPLAMHWSISNTL